MEIIHKLPLIRCFVGDIERSNDIKRRVCGGACITQTKTDGGNRLVWLDRHTNVDLHAKHICLCNPFPFPNPYQAPEAQTPEWVPSDTPDSQTAEEGFGHLNKTLNAILTSPHTRGPLSVGEGGDLDALHLHLNPRARSRGAAAGRRP